MVVLLGTITRMGGSTCRAPSRPPPQQLWAHPNLLQHLHLKQQPKQEQNLQKQQNQQKRQHQHTREQT